MLDKVKSLFSRNRLEGGVVLPVDLYLLNQNLLVRSYGPAEEPDTTDVIGGVAVDHKTGPCAAYYYKVSETPRHIRIDIRKAFPIFGDAPHPIIEINKETGSMVIKPAHGYDLSGTMYLRVVRENLNRRRA